MYKVQDTNSLAKQQSEMESSSNTDNQLIPFEELPYWIKFSYEYSMMNSKKGRYLYLLLVLIYAPNVLCFNVGLAGGNVAVGVGLSLLFLLAQLADPFLVFKVDSEHHYMKMLRRNKILAEKVNKKCKSYIKSTIIGNLFLWQPLLIVGLMRPLLGTKVFDPMFGKDTSDHIIYYGMGIGVLTPIIDSMENAFYKGLTKEISLKLWVEQMESYLNSIKKTLLSKKPKSEILLQLAKEQEIVEDFAHRINTTENIVKGQALVVKTLVVFTPLLLLLLPRTQRMKPLNLTLLLLFSLASLYSFNESLQKVAKPNIVWEKLKQRLLNDFRLAPVVGGEIFQNTEQFYLYLDKHEISGRRACGTHITSLLISKGFGLAASAFSFIFYLVIRNEMQTML